VFTCDLPMMLAADAAIVTSNASPSRVRPSTLRHAFEELYVILTKPSITFRVSKHTVVWLTMDFMYECTLSQLDVPAACTATMYGCIKRRTVAANAGVQPTPAQPHPHPQPHPQAHPKQHPQPPHAPPPGPPQPLGPPPPSPPPPHAGKEADAPTLGRRTFRHLSRQALVVQQPADNNRVTHRRKCVGYSECVSHAPKSARLRQQVSSTNLCGGVRLPSLRANKLASPCLGQITTQACQVGRHATRPSGCCPFRLKPGTAKHSEDTPQLKQRSSIPARPHVKTTELYTKRA
jgi:hypothetical protein